MMSSLMLPVLLIVLTAIWYGTIVGLNALSKARAQQGRDLRD